VIKFCVIFDVVVTASVTMMLIRSGVSLLRNIDAAVGRISHYFHPVNTYPTKCTCCTLSSQFLPRQKSCTPYHHVRCLASNSSSSSSDELCVYQPAVKRIRIVTMNDVQSDDIMQDAAMSQSSVQRETIYTRHHVSADNPTVQSLFQGIREGSRLALARAITLVESVHPKRQAEAQVLLREVLEYSKKKQRHSLHRVSSFRIGNILYYIRW